MDQCVRYIISDYKLLPQCYGNARQFICAVNAFVEHECFLNNVTFGMCRRIALIQRKQSNKVKSVIKCDILSVSSF